jgi:hypothetical protein
VPVLLYMEPMFAVQPGALTLPLLVDQPLGAEKSP